MAAKRKTSQDELNALIDSGASTAAIVEESGGQLDAAEARHPARRPGHRAR